MKMLLIAAGFLAVATSATSAQVYGHWSAPYGYGPGFYNDGGPYAPQPYAAPPGYYGYDPYGSAYNWDYYRVDRPGRGNNEESTR